MILSAPIHVLKRRARSIARMEEIPLSQALDRLARREGYQCWSHLAAIDAATPRAAKLLAGLQGAALVLLGARPGQDKTVLALELLAEAAKSEREAVFFTLEYTQAEVTERLTALNAAKVEIDTADRLDAAHITTRLAETAPGTLAAIDYLQLLDQRRDTAPLDEQLAELRRFALSRQVTLIFLSQIDRHFDPAAKALPDMADLRLPNPVDLGVFDHTIFLNAGALRLAAA